MEVFAWAFFVLGLAAIVGVPLRVFIRSVPPPVVRISATGTGSPWKSTSPQEVVEYANHRDFDDAREGWMANGWRIAAVNEVPRPAGFARIFSLGLLALVVRPEAHVLVVYERQIAHIDAAAESTGASTASVSSELERLTALHERGALSDEEFDNAKRRVIGA